MGARALVVAAVALVATAMVATAMVATAMVATAMVATALAPPTPASGQAGPAAADLAPGRVVVLKAGVGDRPVYTPPPPLRPAGGDSGTQAVTANFSVTYNAAFPTAARTAFQAALDVWANSISSPVTIKVDAAYRSLGAGTLAQSGPTSVGRNFPGAPRADTWYAVPLVEALVGSNLNGGDAEITADFNVRSDWYFGTDGQVPSGRFDFMSVALHELGHGFGVLGSMSVSAGRGSWGYGPPGPPVSPDAFDRAAVDGLGRSLLDTAVYPNPSIALGNALTSGNVFFDSPRTNAVPAARPRLFAPNPWEPGSSFAHVDEGTYPAGSAQSLMTPVLHPAEAEHAPNSITLCILEAMGWATSDPCVPPPPTDVAGFTWYVDGSTSASVAAGATVRAYATGAPRDTPLRLVTGLDGGVLRPCMYDVVPLNPAERRATNLGFVGMTSGVIGRPPGRWQVCLREEGSGATRLVTGPVTLVVP